MMLLRFLKIDMRFSGRKYTNSIGQGLSIFFQSKILMTQHLIEFKQFLKGLYRVQEIQVINRLFLPNKQNLKIRLENKQLL